MPATWFWNSNCIVPRKYGRLILEDIGMGMWALGKALYCHPWTFSGRLMLSATYNTSLYKTAFVEEVLGELGVGFCLDLGWWKL